MCVGRNNHQPYQTGPQRLQNRYYRKTIQEKFTESVKNKRDWKHDVFTNVQVRKN